MPVTFDNINTTTQVLGASTLSLVTSLAVTPNACLIAMVQLRGAAGMSVSSCIANGVSMTQLKRVEVASGTPQANHLFVLTSAPSGTVSISANIVGATLRGMALIVASYVGQRTDANPFSAMAVASNTSVAAANFSVSCSTIDRCVLLGMGTNSLDSNVTVRARSGSNWGVYFGDTAGTINGTSGFSANISMSTAAGFGIAGILLNIAAVRATMDIREFNRMMTGVGF